MLSDGLKKILIIEDDLTYRIPLENYLSARSYVVSTADNGEQAMEKLLFYRPNLALLDLFLPKVDGFGVLKRIRSYPDKEIANIPVIILSNLSSEKDMAKAMAFNIEGYFIKSQTTFDDVFSKVEEAVFKGQVPPTPQPLDFSSISPGQ